MKNLQIQTDFISTFLFGILISLCALNSYATPRIWISSPPSGTIVAPNQSVDITVENEPGLTFQEVVLDSGLSILTNPLSGSGPFHFQISIPPKLQPGILQMSVRGVLATTGQLIDSSDQPWALRISINTDIESGRLDSTPNNLHFKYIGENATIYSKLINSHGKWMDVTDSPDFSLTSLNQNIVSTDGKSLITAIGVGQTQVISSIGSLQFTINVEVNKSIRGDLDADGDVDSQDLNILKSWIGHRAILSSDDRDLNHDGKINSTDSDILTSICTRPQCSSSSDEKLGRLPE